MVHVSVQHCVVFSCLQIILRRLAADLEDDSPIAAEQAVEAADSIDNARSDTVDALDGVTVLLDDMASVQTTARQYTDYVSIGLVLYVSAATIWGILTGFTLLKCRGAHCCFRICHILGLLLTLTLWLVAAAVWVVGLASADTCYNPRTVALELVNPVWYVQGSRARVVTLMHVQHPEFCI